MTDELPPAPLDAYATAKPDEPTFTLQGGDPLAPPLVRLWAFTARLRTGLPIGDACQDAYDELIATAALSSVEDDERGVSNLLIRATAAEEVLWSMSDYQKDASADVARPTSAGENFLDEKARLDLHDARVRYAQKLSSFFSEIEEIRQDLLARKWIEAGEELDNEFQGAVFALRALNEAVEPRRLFQKST